jgi:hypothetical protein
MALLLLCDSQALILFWAPLHVKGDSSIALPSGVLSATRINQVEFDITIGETLAIFFILGKISPFGENKRVLRLPITTFQKRKRKNHYIFVSHSNR